MIDGGYRRGSGRLRRALWGAAGLAMLVPQVGTAETMRDALLRSYQSNPTLMAERDRLRQADEGVAIARSGYRPQLSVTVGVDQDVGRTGQLGAGRGLEVSANGSLPIFTGGRVQNQVRAADARVDAGRNSLVTREGDTFNEAVAGYMDVIRDRSIVSLNENQVRVLETNLRATRDRFEVGEFTRTDIAQSEARLSLARSNLSLAQGQLRASEENYRRVIGNLPADLEPPPMLPELPRTEAEAAQYAVEHNPALRNIADQARAAGYDVAVLRSGRLPTLSVTSTGNYLNRLGSAEDQFGVGTVAPNDQASGGVGASANIPIYQGGLVSARVRQGQALQSQIVEQMIGIERAVVAQSGSAFASYRAALEAIQSNEIAVAANQLALEGTRAELTVGTRNLLDVLNAEQELLGSQVQLITARRNAYVAGFALLNIMGRARVEVLGLDAEIYDPAVHYREVRGIASDWRDARLRGPASTRTVPDDAVSPITPIVQAYGPPAPRSATPAAGTPTPQ